MKERGYSLLIILVIIALFGLGIFMVSKTLDQERSSAIRKTSEVTPTPLSTLLPTSSPILESDDQGIKKYSSKNLGISFSYSNSFWEEMFLKEEGNRVCVTYDKNDADCTKGQYVEVIQKENDETIEAAITRLFLANKDKNKCFVKVENAKGYSSNFIKAEIAYPRDENTTMEEVGSLTEYCGRNYAQTNGIRYFLMDKSHPTKLLFFSIGQYGIMAGKKTWQETIEVL